ncbi:MAG: hypothetical protein NTZ35_10385 [Ignavibacteriales bacterium]|nr:hypothetical protein [Ignavibacteriales bacterium]
MADEDCYSRKISSEESKKGYIFVLKGRLSFFPPKGKTFTLSELQNEKRVKMESYHCTCRGPALPHKHYFIQWDGVQRGEKITITKDRKIAGRYFLVSKK